MTAYAKALIAAILFALGLATGWAANGWRADARIASLRADHAKVLADIADKTAKAVQAVNRAEQVANAAIQAADQKSTKGIADAKAETDRLRACVAAGTCGVRIVTRVVREPSSAGVADSSASTMGDAVIELDAEVQQRVLDLRESVQLDAEKLDYLQRYAETCHKARAQAAE